MKTPNFIIVGAHKAGTSSLHSYLDQHPEIYLFPDKESDFLSRKKFKEINEAEEYLVQFEGAQPGQILGEVSSVYLHGRDCAKNIKHLFPEVKIVVVLRNPIDRAYSHALWQRSYTPDEIRDFDRLIMSSEKILKPGLYYTHLRTYLSYFDKDKVKILMHENLAKNPHVFFPELFDFIGVSGNFQPDTSKRLHSGALKISGPYKKMLNKGHLIGSSTKALVPKAMRKFIREILYKNSYVPKPPMSEKLRLKLIDYYHDEVVNLKQLVGLDVSHWLEIPEGTSASST